LSRYSELSERTYRRHYSQPFVFVEANRHLIDGSMSERTEVIAATDCSFIPKSGKLLLAILAPMLGEMLALVVTWILSLS
jgi:hypothetical protein